jgi:hypothetical protein
MLNPVSLFNAPPHVADRGVQVVCEICGKPYAIKRLRPDRRRRRLCDHCRSVVGIANARRSAPPTTPESTKAERVRANGLLNRRIKLGWFDRPAACQHCGKPGKVDGHHPDYQQPDLCVFLCRSCHMKAHRYPDFEKAVAQKATSSGEVGSVNPIYRAALSPSPAAKGGISL